MANNRDAILLETVKTHRARLGAAFLFGELSERRVANDNVRRLTGGVVLAAVACVACVATSLVTSLLAGQAAARAEAERQQVLAGAGPATGTPYASDTFDRSRAEGWGSAELGGDWQQSTEAGFRVRDGAGEMEMGSGAGRGAFLPAAIRDSTDTTFAFRSDRAGGEGGTAFSVRPRRVSSTADYRVQVVLTEANRLAISLESRQEEDGVVPLSNAITLVGEVERGEQIWVRTQALGINPTTVRAKVWWGNSAEPQTWMLSGTDAYPGLQRPGTVAFAAELPETGSSAGRTVTVSVLDMVARPANS